MGTVSDVFRLLGRMRVLLLVVYHTRRPCARFKPMWSVRGGQGTTFYNFLEPSNKKGLLMPYWTACNWTIMGLANDCARLLESRESSTFRPRFLFQRVGRAVRLRTGSGTKL